MKIITNHHYREILHWHDLTEEEQNFRYGMYDGIEESSFFRYKGMLNDLNDFLYVNNALNGRGVEDELYGWDGYQNDTFFSSTLVKYSDCGDAVKVGITLS